MSQVINVVILIDPIRCKKCGLCQAFCPQKVYTLAKDGTPLVTSPEKCTNCRLCDLRCPDFAITLEVLT
ncbi:4Fe-4S dicluster domain-containing protein [Desulfosporosinus metallidurans]|uniref:Putative 2-oxoglutarate oxidoreductase, delta subunit n=1 Tax=Desulfosporosinus metallidurans TaxID=1888891 RepID=A0A1Q8QZ65_9FIRM|nr:4Fe-4S binding protein [Desulfosporosinus metallidurans]OLN32643.1 putative 2-oxoglutarate oxidoreductase, delta subunit [Desulfosporosinus metallidurans]